MFNMERPFLLSSREMLIGSTIASLMLIAVVLIPQIGQSVATGLVLVPLVGAILFSVPYVLVGIAAVLFGGVIALFFYLLRIKHALFISSVGLSLGYVLFSWLNQTVDAPTYLKAAVFLLAACALFYGLMLISGRLKINRYVSILLFISLLGACVYVAQIIERAVDRPKAIQAHQAYLDAENQEFETAKMAMNFTVYYPTYNSVELPASDLKLNGYSQDRKDRTNPHVTFKLGKARVTQTALLKNQDKLMDFTRNCDIMRLSQAMDSSAEVSQMLIDSSLENLSRCKIVHQTPTGKNIFFRENGQWTTFYLQSEGTNIVIEFDDVNAAKYTEALLPEINKIIDSLQPIALDKIQRGKEMLADRY